MSVDIVPFQTQIAVHNSQMKTNIEGSRSQAYRSIDAYIANNPNISESKRRDLYGNIDRQADQALRMYADDKGIGLLAIANIYKTYRDKSVLEKSQLVDLAIKQQSAMQNNPMVMAYWAGGESRENLKRTNKDFHDVMVNTEKNMVGAIVGLRNDIQGATDLANVQRVIVQSQQSPSTVPIDPIVDKQTTRASHQALMATAGELLRKNEFQPSDINTISAALSTSTEYGANSQLLAKDYRKMGDKIAKMAGPDQSIIKGNVSNSVQKSVTSVSDIIGVINSKYKTELVLGVNDAGEISVVRKPVPAGVIPSESGVSTYNSAAAEFMKQAKPMLNNMVYGRSMLTQEDPEVVGKDFATIINSNQPYTGFYKLEAQSVAPTTQPQPTAPAATTGAVDMDTQVKATLSKMKEQDPNFNTDYVYNAYTRASPEEKKKLAELFKNNNVRMADLSGAGK
jgi:hypothetical protein